MRFTRKKIAAIVAAALVAGGAGATIAIANTGDDGDGRATGPDADRAREAALGLITGGEANAVERDAEDGATWEVEVTRPDGTTVDVRLDERFQAVVIEGDTEDAGGGE
jgi:hypothetical protein